MGGKAGAGSSPPAFIPRETDDTALMLELLKGDREPIVIEAPTTTPLPEIETVPTPDWGKQQDLIRKAMANEFTEEKKKKVGVLDTVLTSYLLDNEDPETTNMTLLE